MKKGFTLIELMVAIAMIAVFIAILLPNIQQAKDAALTGSQKEGPYWVYREYEYAGGPVISEISGSYQHSLQEILDMYVINLKKDQLKNARELQAAAQLEASPLEHPANSDEAVPSSSSSATTHSKAGLIREAKRSIKNLKIELSQNHATLGARRNMCTAIEELQKDLRILESQP